MFWILRWPLRFFFWVTVALVGLLLLTNWRHQSATTSGLAFGAFAGGFRLSAGMVLAKICDIRDRFPYRYSWRPRRAPW